MQSPLSIPGFSNAHRYKENSSSVLLAPRALSAALTDDSASVAVAAVLGLAWVSCWIFPFATSILLLYVLTVHFAKKMGVLYSLLNYENTNGGHHFSGYTKVYFDLESTGTKFPEVCQIGAYFSGNSFSRYVCPNGPFEIVVERLTGFSKRGNSLYYRGERVETVSKMDAWKDFLKFLQRANGRVVLVTHGRHFDCFLLFRDLSKLSLMEEFREVCVGVIDTLPLFRDIFPGRREIGKSYKLKELVEDKLGKESSLGSHNAIADAVNLERLMKLADVQPEIFQRHFFSLSNLEYWYQTKTEVRLLMESFPSMSQSRATSIIKAGITFYDYKRSYMEGGEAGIASLLSGKVKTEKPRYRRKRRPL